MTRLPEGDVSATATVGNDDISRMTVKLWDMEIMQAGPGDRLDRQLTIPHVMVALLQGSGALERDDATCLLRSDAAYFCPQETTFGIASTGDEGCTVAVIRFGLFEEAGMRRKRLEAASSNDWLPSKYGEGISLAPKGRLAAMCRSVQECVASADLLQRWRAQLVFHELFLELIAAGNRASRADTLQALACSKAYMEVHYGEELTIDKLAGIAGVSPKYYVDLFKKTYGVSALDYLTDVRIRKAKRLMLLAGDRLLKDIAHEVGYKDEFYFSRKFRHETGQSPSAFLQKRKRKIAAYGSGSLIGYLLPLQIVPYAAPLHPKWCGYYFDRHGADIPVHLDAYRQNQRKTANLERLAEACPELIVCPAGLQKWEKERLAQIAPLYEMPDDSTGWRHQLRTLGEWLGEGKEAERWIADYDRKAEAVSERIGRSAGRPVVLPVRLLKNRFYAHYSSGIAELLYETLRFKPPHPMRGCPFDLPLEPEQWETLGVDRVLLLVCQETETLEGWRQLRQSSRWLSLGEVRDNRISEIRSEPWREYSPIAMERMLDAADRLFNAESESVNPYGKCP